MLSTRGPFHFDLRATKEFCFQMPKRERERERDLSEEKRAPHFYHIFTRNEHEKKKDTDILNMLINKSKKPRAVI